MSRPRSFSRFGGSLHSAARPPSPRPHATRARRSFFESLEPRYLLASDWQNPLFASDVNDDGFIAADDVLAVINNINAKKSRALTAPTDSNAFYIDVDGDKNVAASDVVSVINFINATRSVLTVDLSLAADTGESDTDELTRDSRILGDITGPHAAITTAKIRMNRGGVFNVPVDANGDFLATPGAWGPITDGLTKAKVYVKDAAGVVGLKHYTFRLDTTPPRARHSRSRPGLRHRPPRRSRHHRHHRPPQRPARGQQHHRIGRCRRRA